MMFRIVKPLMSLDMIDPARTVFLAGSIGTGSKGDWRSYVLRALQTDNLVVFNPQHPKWDHIAEQTISNSQFRQQVEWELAAQELAQIIAMYFAPNSKSPITLLELGLFARSKKLIVCCPDGFWRKGNVQVICNSYHIPLVETLDDLVAAIRSRLAN